MGLVAVVSVCWTPLIINLAISKVPVAADPVTHKLIVSPALSEDLSVDDIRFQSESYVDIAAQKGATEGVVGVGVGVGLVGGLVDLMAHFG